MSLDAWDLASTEHREVDCFVRFTGTGASTPTKDYGRGVTVGRTGAGVITLTWAENQGRYLGVKGFCFEAATQSALKGFTMVPGDYNTSTFTLTLNITGATEVLTDLAAAQHLSLTVAFART